MAPTLPGAVPSQHEPTCPAPADQRPRGDTDACHYVDQLVAGGAPITLRPEVEANFDQRIQAELVGSVWSHCSSWYRDTHGRITTNWPWLGIHYHRKAKFDASDYKVVP
jgi:hypothetical protein